MLESLYEAYIKALSLHEEIWLHEDVFKVNSVIVCLLGAGVKFHIDLRCELDISIVLVLSSIWLQEHTLIPDEKVSQKREGERNEPQ